MILFLFLPMMFFVPEAAEQPYFKLPLQCGQTWEASTYDGHWPNGNSLDFITYADGANVSLGQPLYAPATGTLEFTGWAGDRGGWSIILDHGGGWKTHYLHLREQSFLPQGQEVKQGQHMGFVGNTGSNNGKPYVPHLHYTVMAGDAAQRAVFSGQPAAPHEGDLTAKEKLTSRNCGSSWDGDARAELVVVDPDGTVKAYLNHGRNGLATFAASPGVIGTGRDPARTFFADTDGDGKREIVDTPHADLDGDRKDLPVAGPHADLDGDGRDEPVTLEGKFADLDGDGRDDLIKVTPGGDVEAYWNNGNGFQPAPEVVAKGIGDPARLLFA